jgi:hypothetical protein
MVHIWATEPDWVALRNFVRPDVLAEIRADHGRQVAKTRVSALAGELAEREVMLECME